MERIYFDCNATFGPKPHKPLEARWTLEHLRQDLDLCGIAGALVQHAQCLHGDPMRANRAMVRRIDRYRDRLFPCWVAFPGASGEFPDVKTFMRELKDNDVKAVRIEARHFAIPEREILWGELRDALLAENILVVMCVDRPAPDLRHIEQLLDIFKQNKVLLLDHFWRQWRTVHYLMQTCPNLHIDFSSFQANRAVEYFAARFGAERCLFGTGLMDKAGGAGRGFLDWTLLPNADADKVAGGNLRRLLGNVGPQKAPAPTQWHDTLTAAARSGKALHCEIWDNHCQQGEVPVSGEGKEIVNLPKYSDPASKKLWKPVIDGIAERLKKHGLEKTIVYGIGEDMAPAAHVTTLFESLRPKTEWVIHSHGSSAQRFSKIVSLALRADVWSSYFAVDPDKARSYGWQNKKVDVNFPRDTRDHHPIIKFRFAGELNIAGKQNGFGRFGGDFWSVLPDKKGKMKGTLGIRYNTWRNLDIKCTLLAPGKEGAVSTHRFEMMREGMQECEARIFIERALLEKKISGELAKKCQYLLDERTRAMLRGTNSLMLSARHWAGLATCNVGWWMTTFQVGYQWYVSSDWQGRSEDLYSLADEVAKKLEGG